MLLLTILGFAFAGGIASVLLAGLILLLPVRTHSTVLPCLISYAIGTLLGAALLGLLPHALAHAPVARVMAGFLGGIILFFVLEGALLLRHCHDQACPTHATAGALILIGDALHNFVDGVLLTAAFLASWPIGVATGLAIVSHEVPQEAGDFAILLHSGYSRAEALGLNVAVSLTTFLGALGAYWWRDVVTSVLPDAMAIAAASFVYIALADMLPAVHQRRGAAALARQLTLMLAGVGTIVMLHRSAS